MDLAGFRVRVVQNFGTNDVSGERMRRNMVMGQNFSMKMSSLQKKKRKG